MEYFLHLEYNGIFVYVKKYSKIKKIFIMQALKMKKIFFKLIPLWIITGKCMAYLTTQLKNIPIFIFKASLTQV